VSREPPRHSAARWAWEFLRRNPGYRRQWRAFKATWDALEAAYGRPPRRDFNAWKRDPRAWVSAAECPEGECRVDQDKVLIECALGARWGFYKFPPDPDDAEAVEAGRLRWRPLERTAVEVRGEDPGWLGADPARVALGFDLRLPLAPQWAQAKRRLQILQRRRLRCGEIRLLRIRELAPRLALCLRLLDREAAGEDPARDPELAGEDLAALRREALAWRDGGYRTLAGLPE